LEIAARQTGSLLFACFASRTGRISLLQGIADIAGINSLAELPEVAPSNFLLCPQLEDHKKEIARECLQEGRTRCGLIPPVSGNLDEWNRIVRRILRDGI
jgi:hypothetical protein